MLWPSDDPRSQHAPAMALRSHAVVRSFWRWRVARARDLPVLLLALGAIGCALACDDNSGVVANAPATGPQEVGVTTLQARPITLSEELPGRTVAALRAEVRPQVGGILLEQCFEEGSEVEAGQVLYRIDPRPYQAAYREAKAALAHAEASVQAARLRSERYRDLVDVEAVSKQEADDAAANFQQTMTGVEQAKAALSTARINLDYSEVKAPISGRAGISNVTVGALLTASQTEPLTIIRNLSRIYVDVTQSSAELLRLRNVLRGRGASPAAAEVTLKLDDGSDYAHRGELKTREVAVEESTGAVTLRAVFPNPEHELLPGMYVRAVLPQVQLPAAILAPQQGIARGKDGRASALIVTAEDKVEQRAVEVSRTVDAAWLVESGLQDGDRIILEGAIKVKPGDTVRAVDLDRKPRAAAPTGDSTASSVAVP